MAIVDSVVNTQAIITDINAHSSIPDTCDQEMDSPPEGEKAGLVITQRSVDTLRAGNVCLTDGTTCLAFLIKMLCV